MNYFHSHSLPPDGGIVTAWDSQLAAVKQSPLLGRLLAERGPGLFSEFTARYAEMRALPRSARRALQRRLAQSRELTGLPSEMRRRLAYSIAGAALLLALAQAPATEAGSIFVNTKIGDVDEINPTCSLGDAIRSADSGSDYGGCTGATTSPNTIYLPSGGMTLTTHFTDYYGYTGLPVIQSVITITGNNTKIARKSKTFFRHFAVASGGHLTLDGVALSGGNASSNGTISGSADGGAIHNRGSLTIQNSTISGNVGSRGGAIFTIGNDVTVDASVLSKNTASAGGAIFDRSGYLRIQNNTIITGNKASYGGGIYTYFGGMTYIYGSTLSKNSADAGGAVFTPNGFVKILDGSIVTGNKASGDGGGINNHSVTIIDDSTVSKNSAGARGGGVFSGNTLTLTNSTITGNKAGSDGGGLYATGTLSSSGNTVTKNKAPTDPDVGP